MNQREYKIEKTYTAVRYEVTSSTAPASVSRWRRTASSPSLTMGTFGSLCSRGRAEVWCTGRTRAAIRAQGVMETRLRASGK